MQHQPNLRVFFFFFFFLLHTMSIFSAVILDANPLAFEPAPVYHNPENVSSRTFSCVTLLRLIGLSLLKRTNTSPFEMG